MYVYWLKTCFKLKKLRMKIVSKFSKNAELQVANDPKIG